MLTSIMGTLFASPTHWREAVAQPFASVAPWLNFTYELSYKEGARKKAHTKTVSCPTSSPWLVGADKSSWSAVQLAQVEGATVVPGSVRRQGRVRLIEKYRNTTYRRRDDIILRLWETVAKILGLLKPRTSESMWIGSKTNSLQTQIV